MTTKQTERVYQAEHSVWGVFDQARKSGDPLALVCGSTLPLPDELLFGNLDAVRTYLARLAQQDWYSARWGRRGVPQVRQRKGNSLAHYEPGVIALHASEQRGVAWSMREFVVLHELAHHLSRDDDDIHGSLFTGAHLHLVTNAIGWVAGLLLTEAYDLYGCQVKRVETSA